MMPRQPKPDPGPAETEPTAGASPRKAGAFLVLTALLTALSAVSRVSAQADQGSLEESLTAISLHPVLYGLGGAARLVSGLTLVAAAWLLLKTWIIRMRLGSPRVPALLKHGSSVCAWAHRGCQPSLWLRESSPRFPGRVPSSWR